MSEPTYDELIKTFKIENLIDPKEFAELKAIDAEFKQSKEEERLEYLRKHNEKYPSTFNLWEGNKYKSNILKYKKDYGITSYTKAYITFRGLNKDIQQRRGFGC